MSRYYKITLLFTIIFNLAYAQKPEKLSSAEIFHRIEKLNFLGSVLYIAAHPDDENTRLISYMANHQKARTAYLSLTRGDGGQNLIGTEIREGLGVIRTQELIEARKIDGGIQFFSRANDFGFSKNPNETLKIWDKEAVLSDMTYVIRKFKPDVIITRFDHRSPGTTHGHHTSSAMLTQEAFDISANKNNYPEHLKLVKPWQPERLYFNVSYFFYGNKEKFDKADKSHLINFESGVFYPLLGKSNQEIAALSRSAHQSQGFGATGSRGEDLEYLEFIKGKSNTKPKDIFNGIETSWKRVKNSELIEKNIGEIIKNYDFKNPAASIPQLVNTYKLIDKIDDEHWKKIKQDEIIQIIQACAGLYLEAVASDQYVAPEDSVIVNIEAINRSNSNIKLLHYSIEPIGLTHQTDVLLSNNQLNTFQDQITIPKNSEYTDPYWLKHEGTLGMYRVDQLENIGKPDVLRNFKVIFILEIENQKFNISKNIIYKYNDPVKGEVYHPFDISPKIHTSFVEKVKIFNANSKQKVQVKVTASSDNVSGKLILSLPENWKIISNEIPFNIKVKGNSQILTFEVVAPKIQSEILASVSAVSNNIIYDLEKIDINYNHISRQQILKKSQARFINIEVETRNNNIGYIMGAGDDVPQYLSQLGYTISIINPNEITDDLLKKYQAIIVGIRAYNTIEELKFKQENILEYVKNGGNLIVQYNTTGKLVTDQIAPYALKISRDRVTQEDAKVRFLNPNHEVLNFPNKITQKDFEGWVQEQGLYYPNEWSSEFTPIISSNDDGESPKDGSLLIAKYGKGNYIYTGLSFFRELPAGVIGAYRLFANMIALKKNEK